MVNIQPTSTQDNWKNYAIIGGASLGAVAGLMLWLVNKISDKS